MNRRTSTDWLLPKNKTTMCVRDIMLNKEPSTVYIRQVTHCSPCPHALSAAHRRRPWANAVWSVPSWPPSGTICSAPGHAASVHCAPSRCIAHLVIAQKERRLKKKKKVAMVAMRQLSTPLQWILKNELWKAIHSCRITCVRCKYTTLVDIQKRAVKSYSLM